MAAEYKHVKTDTGADICDIRLYNQNMALTRQYHISRGPKGLRSNLGDTMSDASISVEFCDWLIELEAHLAKGMRILNNE